MHIPHTVVAYFQTQALANCRTITARPEHDFSAYKIVLAVVSVFTYAWNLYTQIRVRFVLMFVIFIHAHVLKSG